MKFRKNMIVDWCIDCKSEINTKDGFVLDKKGNCYHLECYHLIHDIPLEIEEKELEDINDSDEE